MTIEVTSVPRPVSIRRRTLLRAIAALPAILATSPLSAEDDIETEATVEDVLTPVSRRYTALQSYSDTGTVEISQQWPGAPLITERHRFETYFRAPRNFFFRFDEDPSSGRDALVIWCDGGDFQSWWKTTGVHEVYSGGRGATAFVTAQYPTNDAASLVAPHIFPGAGLYGPTIALVAPEDVGDVELDGRRARRFVANERIDGVQTRIDRPTAMLVDAESGLFVRVEIETEAGSTAGAVDRKVFVIKPVVNPQIPDERFAFAPPGGDP